MTRRQAQIDEVADHLSSRPTYFHVAGPGVTQHDLLAPNYWTAVGEKFRGKRFGLVEAVAMSGAWECRLRVDELKADGATVMTSLWEWHSPTVIPQLPPPI
jgi:hypothetical protein